MWVQVYMAGEMAATLSPLPPFVRPAFIHGLNPLDSWRTVEGFAHDHYRAGRAEVTASATEISATTHSCWVLSVFGL
jgi:hypothetical protein